MAITAFLKPSYMLAGASTAVVPIGGWQIYEITYPTANSILERKGLEYRLLAAELGINDPEQIKGTSDKFGFVSEGECFERLFDLNPDASSITFTEQENDKSSEAELKDSAGITATPKSAIGCTIMTLQQKDKDFLFKTEVVMRDSSGGIAIWAAMKKVGSEIVGLQYYLVYVVFKDGEHKIAGGYSWKDTSLVSNKLDVSNIFISYPGIDSNILSHTGTPQDTWTSTSYAGIWEATYKRNKPQKGSEILEGIEVYLLENNKKKSDEVFGVKTKNTEERFDKKVFGTQTDENVPGYYNANLFYEEKGGQWVWTAGKTDATDDRGTKNVAEDMKHLYLNFSSTRGTWTPVEDYCRNSSKKRSLNNRELYRIAEICYDLAAAED